MVFDSSWHRSARLAFLALSLGACASVGNRELLAYPETNPINWSDTERRILVLEPQFDMREETVGSNSTKWTQTRYEWNKEASVIARDHLSHFLRDHGIVIVGEVPFPCTYMPVPDDKREPPQKLITCAGAPDVMRALRAQYPVNYALVLRARQNYDKPLTRGEMLGWGVLGALSIPLPGIAIGAGLVKASGYCDRPCGATNRAAYERGEKPKQPDFAAAEIIDMRSGSIVWSNITKGGNWRDTAAARIALEDLLNDAPL